MIALVRKRGRHDILRVSVSHPDPQAWGVHHTMVKDFDKPNAGATHAVGSCGLAGK